jgi:hypothetical protein
MAIDRDGDPRHPCPMIRERLRESILRVENHVATTELATRVWPHRGLDVAVVSYGGSGSTFVLQFLRRFMRVNNWNSLKDGIKHVHTPDHPILRGRQIAKAIYIYDDPIRAVTSLFRREYHVHMIPKLNCEHRSARAYRDHVLGNPNPIDFKTFLAQGEDLFHFERHYRCWSSAVQAPFPILLVKFDGLFANKERILEFVELPRRFWSEFPKEQPRQSRPDALDAADQARLQEMYGALSAEISASEPIRLRPAGT